MNHFSRPVDGYRTLDPGYRVHSRPQLDPYAAQPQVGRMGSAMEISGLQRFVPEPYGLEDDQRSLGYDEPDYGMGPPMHYSTMPRLGHHAPAPRRTGLVQKCLCASLCKVFMVLLVAYLLDLVLL